MNKHPGIEIIEGKKGRSYKVRYRDASGGQRAKAFGTLAEAKAFKGSTDQARRTGGLTDTRPDKVTFAQLTEAWRQSKRHRPSTALRRDGILNNHLLPVLGHLTLDKIRYSTLQDLVNRWTSQGLKPNTIRNHVRTLVPILDRAVKDDLLAKNPASGLELPKIHRKEARALTPDECISLIEAADDDYAPIIEMLLATGCRWGEFAALNIEDFSAKDHTLRIKNSKTDAGNRTIDLGPEFSNVIIKHLLATGRSGAPVGSPLFTSPKGARLVHANFRARVFLPACQRAGLTDITIHSLRRTHATMLITRGDNAKAVQHRMGHASIQTTLSYYAVATEADRRNTAGAMSDYLARSSRTRNTRSEAV